MLEEKKSKGAPTGSEDLGIRPLMGEVSVPITNKLFIPSVALSLGTIFGTIPRHYTLQNLGVLEGRGRAYTEASKEDLRDN